MVAGTFKVTHMACIVFLPEVKPGSREKDVPEATGWGPGCSGESETLRPQSLTCPVCVVRDGAGWAGTAGISGARVMEAWAGV